MRPWILVALVCTSSPVVADVSVAADGAPRRLAACVTALRTELHPRYPRPSDESDEHYCTFAATGAKVTFHCYGACTDRNCHNDGCTRHDGELEISLALHRAPPSPWTRAAPSSWEIEWQRQLGPVRASVIQYGETASERVSQRDLGRVQRTIDACLQ